MRGACGTNGRDENARHQFEYLGEDGQINKKIGNVYSLEYTKIPKVSFTPH
jgi:hypothetical protein